MKKVFAVLFLVVAAVAGWCAPELRDSIGTVGIQIGQLFKKIGLSESLVSGLVPVLGAAAFRLFQIILQKLPTKWKWVNNKLTLGIVNKILSGLFGKTTMIYNAQITLTSDPAANEKAKNKLKEEAAKHLARNGGILNAFNNAMKEMK